MIFLANTPAVNGPMADVETGWGFLALVWTEKERVHQVVEVTWGITDMVNGSDGVPGTWSLGGETYHLRNSSIGRGYGKVQGTITARYWKRGTWAWVT